MRERGFGFATLTTFFGLAGLATWAVVFARLAGRLPELPLVTTGAIAFAGALAVLAVNGRIRESVGATHVDMAEILRKRGMQTAMGFDPGGSATLVVDGQTMNISPYNQDYERNVYALPPQPRAVANAVVAY